MNKMDQMLTNKVAPTIQAKPDTDTEKMEAVGRLLGIEEDKGFEAELTELGVNTKALDSQQAQKPDKAPEAKAEAQAEPESDPDLEAARNVLRFDHWTDAELEGLSPAHIKRMAERRAAKDKAQEEDGAITDLDLEIKKIGLGDEQTKALKTLFKSVEDRIARAERVSGDTRVERVVESFKGLYPEFEKPVVRGAVVKLALEMQRPGDTDRTATQRALEHLYGRRRQTEEQRAEARAQLRGQPDLPDRRERAAKPNPDAAKIAAYGTFLRTGSRDQAVKVRQELGG